MIVKLPNGLIGRKLSEYEASGNQRANVQILRFSDPPHPRHGDGWSEVWCANVDRLTEVTDTVPPFYEAGFAVAA